VAGWFGFSANKPPLEYAKNGKSMCAVVAAAGIAVTVVCAGDDAPQPEVAVKL